MIHEPLNSRFATVEDIFVKFVAPKLRVEYNDMFYLYTDQKDLCPNKTQIQEGFNIYYMPRYMHNEIYNGIKGLNATLRDKIRDYYKLSGTSFWNTITDDTTFEEIQNKSPQANSDLKYSILDCCRYINESYIAQTEAFKKYSSVITSDEFMSSQSLVSDDNPKVLSLSFAKLSTTQKGLSLKNTDMLLTKGDLLNSTDGVAPIKQVTDPEKIEATIADVKKFTIKDLENVYKLSVFGYNLDAVYKTYAFNGYTVVNNSGIHGPNSLVRLCDIVETGQFGVYDVYGTVNKVYRYNEYIIASLIQNTARAVNTINEPYKFEIDSTYVATGNELPFQIISVQMTTAATDGVSTTIPLISEASSYYQRFMLSNSLVLNPTLSTITSANEDSQVLDTDDTDPQIQSRAFQPSAPNASAIEGLMDKTTVSRDETISSSIPIQMTMDSPYSPGANNNTTQEEDWKPVQTGSAESPSYKLESPETQSELEQIIAKNSAGLDVIESKNPDGTIGLIYKGVTQNLLYDDTTYQGNIKNTLQTPVNSLSNIAHRNKVDFTDTKLSLFEKATIDNKSSISSDVKLSDTEKSDSLAMGATGYAGSVTFNTGVIKDINQIKYVNLDQVLFNIGAGIIPWVDGKLYPVYLPANTNIDNALYECYTPAFTNMNKSIGKRSAMFTLRQNQSLHTNQIMITQYGPELVLTYTFNHEWNNRSINDRVPNKPYINMYKNWEYLGQKYTWGFAYDVKNYKDYDTYRIAEADIDVLFQAEPGVNTTSQSLASNFVILEKSIKIQANPKPSVNADPTLDQVLTVRIAYNAYSETLPEALAYILVRIKPKIQRWPLASNYVTNGSAGTAGTIQAFGQYTVLDETLAVTGNFTYDGSTTWSEHNMGTWLHKNSFVKMQTNFVEKQSETVSRTPEGDTTYISMFTKKFAYVVPEPVRNWTINRSNPTSTNIESTIHAWGQNKVKVVTVLCYNQLTANSRFLCNHCGYIFEYQSDELPENYECPICGNGKNGHEKITVNNSRFRKCPICSKIITDPETKHCSTCGYTNKYETFKPVTENFQVFQDVPLFKKQ